MSRLPATSSASRPGRWPGLGLGAGLATAALVLALDVLVGADEILTTALILAPFVTALLGATRETTAIAIVVAALAAVSGLWNDNFAELDYFLRLVIVLAGGAVALVSVVGRTREVAARERFGVLMQAARVVDDPLSLRETVERLSDLMVPAVADACIFDLNRAGELERIKVHVAGSPSDAEIERLLADRGPSSSAAGLGVFESGRGRLLERVSDEHLIRAEGDDSLARALRARTAMAVPLRARGRSLGLLTLIVTETSGRTYGSGDVEFAELLAGRAGLALDNAGLFSELSTAEAQFTAVLGSLAEAVTVQSAEGLVYANEVAAAEFGFGSPEELLATPPSEIVDRFDTFHEDGSPLRMEELPGRLVLAGKEAPPLVVRTIDKSTGEERWRVTKATPVRDREGRVQLAVNIIEDITEVKKAELAQRVLAQVGEVLASSLEYEHTLQRVAELAVPELADWCGVSIPGADGLIEQVAVAHVNPEKVSLAWELSRKYPVHADEPRGSAAVIRDGKTQVVTDVSEEMLVEAARDEEHLRLLRALGIRAALIVPMTTPAGTIGALTLVTAESGRTFDSADVELAEEMGRRAGAAVANARLYTERSHIARTLQRGLLPPALPQMPGWASATLYRPAGRENWVGGDFYDAFAIDDGWMLVVGDVVGHGPGAAALTAEARYTLRTAGQLTGSALVALSQLNQGLFARDPGMALCTAACVTLRDVGGRGQAEVVCAGHPLPLLLRNGGIEAVGHPGPMLGAWEAKDWEPMTVPLDPGDVLVLYTDGVIDAEGESERFGERRLRTALAGAEDAGDAIRRIGGQLSAFEAGAQGDDTAVLAVSRVRVPGSVTTSSTVASA